MTARPAFRIRPAVAADIPLFTPIANAAFANDTHTLMKDSARGAAPGVVRSMDASYMSDFLDHPKVFVGTAVVEEDAGEKPVGYVAWGKFNFDGGWPEVRNLYFASAV